MDKPATTDSVALTAQERDLIETIRAIQYGSVKAVIQQGRLVRVEETRSRLIEAERKA